MGKLFGTDGVRGVVNLELDPLLAYRLAQSICEVFGKGSYILVGRDVRSGGEMLVKSVIAGLLSCGCKACYAGLAPTPAIQYAVRNHDEFDGGIIVTASHNPPMYNGIKVVAEDGVEIPREMEEEIEEVYFQGRVKTVDWRSLCEDVKRLDSVIDEYIAGVIDLVDQYRIRQKKMTVIVDAANSVGALTVPRVVRELGGKPVSLNSHLDPLFPGREPEPTPETLRLASKVVVEAEASFGVGLDGDADRSIFIDDKGKVYWGDRTAVVLVPFLKEKHPELPPRIHTGVSSSFFIEDILSRNGVEVRWLKVGSVGIARAMIKERSLLGFEENGGIMYPPHQPVRDATMATALMMEMLAYTGQKLSELYRVYPETYTIKTKYPMSRGEALKVVEAVKERFKGHRMVTIDGVKVLLEDGSGWFLVRPSGTEPVLRVMIECLDENRAVNLKEIIENIIKEVKKP